MTDTATAPATDINIAPDALPAAPATPSVEQQQQINVEKARARRNEILADKTLTKKLMEGDPDLRAEMTRLNATIAGQDIGSAIQSSLNGAEPSEWSNITTEGILSKEEYASADGILRPHSALREIFAEFAAGATVSQERHNEAKMIKEWFYPTRNGVRPILAAVWPTNSK